MSVEIVKSYARTRNSLFIPAIVSQYEALKYRSEFLSLDFALLYPILDRIKFPNYTEALSLVNSIARYHPNVNLHELIKHLNLNDIEARNAQNTELQAINDEYRDIVSRLDRLEIFYKKLESEISEHRKDVEIYRNSSDDLKKTEEKIRDLIGSISSQFAQQTQRIERLSSNISQYNVVEKQIISDQIDEIEKKIKDISLNRLDILSAIDEGDVGKLRHIIQSNPSCIVECEKVVFPLHAAILSGNKEICKVLIQSGADVNAKDRNSETALCLACIKGFKDIVRTLLLNDADPNLANDSGVTPLHICAIKGYADISELLVRYGANLNIRDHRGESPIQLAIKNKNDSVCDYLLLRGVGSNRFCYRNPSVPKSIGC